MIFLIFELTLPHNPLLVYKIHRIMEEKKIEGLLLQSTSYLGSQKILKILTPSDGLITVMAKKKALEALCSPFLIAEWVYRIGKGEIHTLKDATLIHDLSELRKTYAVISVAGQIAQDLLKSQWPEKPGSGPYLLAVAFLQKLGSFPNPETFLASFRLKLLLHDGLLGEDLPLPFSDLERDVIHELTCVRQFSLLQGRQLDKTLQEKIAQLFNYLNS